MNALRKTRRWLWNTLLVIAPLLLLYAACTRPPVLATDVILRPQSDGLTKHFRGEIAEVGSEKLVVIDATGDQERFAVPHEARIMLNDTDASLRMLQAGQLATVQAESRGGEWVAMTIHARRQY